MREARARSYRGAMRLLGVLLLVGTFSPLAVVSPASAAPADCTPAMTAGDGVVTLVDPVGASWDVLADGAIDDGALLTPGGEEIVDDAYDQFPFFAIDDGVNGREVYANPA